MQKIKKNKKIKTKTKTKTLTRNLYNNHDLDFNLSELCFDLRKEKQFNRHE